MAREPRRHAPFPTDENVSTEVRIISPQVGAVVVVRINHDLRAQRRKLADRLIRTYGQADHLTADPRFARFLIDFEAIDLCNKLVVENQVRVCIINALPYVASGFAVW